PSALCCLLDDVAFSRIGYFGILSAESPGPCHFVVVSLCYYRSNLLNCDLIPSSGHRQGVAFAAQSELVVPAVDNDVPATAVNRAHKVAFVEYYVFGEKSDRRLASGCFRVHCVYQESLIRVLSIPELFGLLRYALTRITRCRQTAYYRADKDQHTQCH